MGFLDRFRQSQKADLHQDWQVIATNEELAAAIQESHQKPVVLFKHSVSCGISSMAKHQLERDWDFEAGDLSFYYLDLLSHRPVSNKIAETLGVVHQSPQIILISKGKAVYNTSHHGISVSDLHRALKRA